jgi:hypothetical protein
VRCKSFPDSLKDVDDEINVIREIDSHFVPGRYIYVLFIIKFNDWITEMTRSKPRLRRLSNCGK